MRRLPLLALVLATPATAQVEGTVGEYSDATVTGSILEPEPVTVTDDAELASLVTVPEGFTVSVAGRDLGGIRILATHGDHVYATRRQEGDVIRLIDADGDGDGVFEDHATVATADQMHGIWIDGDTAYLATVKEVFTAPIQEDGSFGDLTPLVDDLPDGGQHPNRTLALGPDGLLYVSVGSTCNACAETSEESATILRMRPDGSGRTIFAEGLRNTIGFGWEPGTGALWGADHGIDWLGDEEQIEELNLIAEGTHYGWPYIYGDDEFNPQDNPPPGEGTLADWAERSEEPVQGYTPHAAPMQMVFYTGDAFPEAYRGDAFIAMRGSWNRRPPSGYELARIDFENGQPVSWEPFATGFLIEYDGPRYGFLGRLVGAAQTAEGDLLLGDDTQGILYRISATGN
ncbi:PQQ-dependent sugar dehydrogenase [Rubellimicrobium aerolatum]|uniref:PQQ-dependent sugar dehydrogenase n=1 Tax=Rubellimicrobium aerolatum TaxID=490979 RepID=A0ABW0SFA5_9RHOB|nr:PQQ-dependent sugar dehydrogenase [Rubellimicrobium aerolatum]MBP1807075.1 glucose/arabinose dehydrogenase [Rubellimicrobium aerolatum]